jgi:hypothetical protein
MNEIKDDGTFQAALKILDKKNQRIAAAHFVKHVLPLCEDIQINECIKIAADHNASHTELSEALKIAKHSALDNRARDGIEGNWHKQAGYFVARAAIAALSPCCQMPAGIAWNAATSCRLARASDAIDNGYNANVQEREDQYSILNKFLDTKGEMLA